MSRHVDEGRLFGLGHFHAPIDAYARKVLDTQPNSLVGYWPLSEATGSTAVDLSAQKNNGAYTAVTLGATGIGDSRTGATFDGTTSFCNIYSAALQSDFSTTEGTILAWAKVASAAVWEDGADRQIVAMRITGANEVAIYRSSAANNRITTIFTGGSTSKTRAVNSLTTTGWMCWALTWSASADEVKTYLNGSQQGTTLTSVPVWAGPPTTAFIGSLTSVPAQVWSGSIAHVAIWNVALAAGEVLALAAV